MKTVLVVGGGISGVFFAIRLKEKHPEYHVVIFEHNEKLLKKLYATGNGKCNFANKGSLKNRYNREETVLPIIESFNHEKIVEYFHLIGVESKEVGDLIYPYSERAETVANALLKRVNELNIEVHLSENVLDYDGHTLITNKDNYQYDNLIIACGGKAAPQLGSDGMLLDTLYEKKGYMRSNPYPSLCPIVTEENTHMIAGLRHKCLVSLQYQKEYSYEISGWHRSGEEDDVPTYLAIPYKEEGEVLFKDDGLSGIVIYNVSHFINIERCYDNAEIHLDFAPGRDGEYESLVDPHIAKYLREHNMNIHDAVFHFKRFYDFKNAQVSTWNFNSYNLNEDFSTTENKDIYFIGEAAGIFAMCGGFNIMWALASADMVANKI